MSFTRTKDRIWAVYDVAAAWLAKRSMPVRRAGYGLFGLILWLAYLVPKTKVRATMAALARQVGDPGPRPLFARFVTGFLRGMNRTEQVRHGHVAEIDAMLTIPDEDRLQRLMEQGGAVMVVPHTHASLAMGRGLCQRYPVFLLVKTTGNERRAASERQIYDQFGCDYMDVRIENPAKVARGVLKALREGKLVVATVDRLRRAPPSDMPVDGESDMVRVTAFGAPVGVAGWPVRFAGKACAPILLARVSQTDTHIVLNFRPEVMPGADIVETTQAWMGELEALMRAYPDEWTFALDKHWSRVLREAG